MQGYCPEDLEGQALRARVEESWGRLVGCSGDFISCCSNGPYGACYGLLCGLKKDTNWTY